MCRLMHEVQTRREERTDIFGSDGKYSQEVQADA
jgi:hypothetical protein